MGKIFGFLLLAVGLAVIGFTVYLTVNVFTGKTVPPQIFKADKKADVSLQGLNVQQLNLQDLQKQIQDMMAGSTQNMLTSDPVIKLLNLIAFSIFAGILIFAGGQIGGLGIQMMKDRKE